MEWISVKDRLPTKNKNYKVLRKCSDDVNALGYCHFKDGKFIDDLEEVAGEITHWLEG